MLLQNVADITLNENIIKQKTVFSILDILKNYLPIHRKNTRRNYIRIPYWLPQVGRLGVQIQPKERKNKEQKQVKQKIELTGSTKAKLLL